MYEVNRQEVVSRFVDFFAVNKEALKEQYGFSEREWRFYHKRLLSDGMYFIDKIFSSDGGSDNEKLRKTKADTLAALAAYVSDMRLANNGLVKKMSQTDMEDIMAKSVKNNDIVPVKCSRRALANTYSDLKDEVDALLNYDPVSEIDRTMKNLDAAHDRWNQRYVELSEMRKETRIPKKKWDL